MFLLQFFYFSVAPSDDSARPETQGAESKAEAIKPTQHETQASEVKPKQHQHVRSHAKYVLRFSTVKGRNDMGKAVIHFRNISEKPLNFKLKCEQGSNIAAHPAGNGVVAPHSAHRCILTWHRPRDAIAWSSLKPPRLAIVSNFFTGSDFTIGDKHTTKFIGSITETEEDAEEKPPTTKVTFNINSSPSVSAHRTSPKLQQNVPIAENMKEEAIQNTDLLYYNALLDWMQLHPTEVLVGSAAIFVGAAFVLSDLIDE
uniref:MSP domain-containing protein n=1 Tax=Ascaris lumbricoides TaxID=6252 RepID=A0A0M3I0C7_ASCLU